MRRNDVQVSDYFWAYEAECPCCGTLVIRRKLLTIMDAIRDNHGGPVTPTSWCRCVRHNTAVYVEKNQRRAKQGLPALYVNHSSPHLIGAGPSIKNKGGWAVDLPIIVEGNELDRTEDWMRALGVVGVGFGANFTHVDIKPREGVAFRSWVYDNGQPVRRTLVPKE